MIDQSKLAAILADEGLTKTAIYLGGRLPGQDGESHGEQEAWSQERQDDLDRQLGLKAPKGYFQESARFHKPVEIVADGIAYKFVSGFFQFDKGLYITLEEEGRDQDSSKAAFKMPPKVFKDLAERIFQRLRQDFYAYLEKSGQEWRPYTAPASELEEISRQVVFVTTNQFKSGRLPKWVPKVVRILDNSLPYAERGWKKVRRQ